MVVFHAGRVKMLPSPFQNRKKNNLFTLSVRNSYLGTSLCVNDLYAFQVKTCWLSHIFVSRSVLKNQKYMQFVMKTF